MQHWDLRSLEVAPHQPEVLQSQGEGRSIVIQLPAGEALGEHQVHERAWLVVVDGAPVPTEHREAEQEPALDRLRGAFAYHPSGRVAEVEKIGLTWSEAMESWRRPRRRDVALLLVRRLLTIAVNGSPLVLQDSEATIAP